MADATTGTLIADRYRLEHQVGEGGMGSVWVAEDEKLERWVAVKLLGEGVAKSRSVRERFEREAMAIAKLRSPHVVQIFDYGAAAHGDDGHAFIVMELLSGQDLYTWLKDHRPVPLEMIARIVGQVAKALSAAHRAGIIHRDLKPANIFVVRDHEEEIVKVFDFGLAKGLSELSPLRELEDRTGEGVLLGTPRYMSPEQAHGAREVDHRSDLWSLAVIAYLATTGRLPFEGRGVGEVITKIATSEPAPVSEVMTSLPSEMDAFFAKALAKLPEDRFQSAMDLAEAFEGLCGLGRTSRELIPVGDDGDTFVDLTHADTMLGPSSSDAATVERVRVIPSPPPEPSVSTLDGADDAPPTSPSAGIDVLSVAPVETRSLGRWLAGMAALVLALGLGWAISRDDEPPQASPGTAPTILVTPALVPDRTVPPADEVSEVPDEPPSDDARGARTKRRRPRDTPAGTPSATPSGEPVSERGLELFEDRH